MTNNILKNLFFISIMFLFFLFGIEHSINKGYFYNKRLQVARYLGALSHLEKIKQQTPWWSKAENKKIGVVKHDPDSSYEGYTLVITNTNKAYLIDMNGQVVHEWYKPIGAILPDKYDSLSLWDSATVLSNGDLIVNYIHIGDPFYGNIIAWLDKDSGEREYYKVKSHHILDFNENGNIYTLENAVVQNNKYNIPDMKVPFLDPFVTLIDKDGKPSKRIYIIKSFLNSKYKDFFLRYANFRNNDDFLHPNKVQFVDKSIANNFSFLQEGHILVSVREMDALISIDPSKETVTWLLTGSWKKQHDPDFLNNGHILLFDNRGLLESKGIERSRVLEYDPQTNEIVWSFSGDNGNKFFSPFYSSQQRLPNGNTLIAESERGRIIEVTMSGKIVWEYLLPIFSTGEDGTLYRGIIPGATRYQKAYFDFLN